MQIFAELLEVAKIGYGQNAVQRTKELHMFDGDTAMPVNPVVICFIRMTDMFSMINEFQKKRWLRISTKRDEHVYEFQRNDGYELTIRMKRYEMNSIT